MMTTTEMLMILFASIGIRMDFKNGTAITLAYLTDTDHFLRTARTQILE